VGPERVSTKSVQEQPTSERPLRVLERGPAPHQATTSSRAGIQQLQRAAGNRATVRLLSTSGRTAIQRVIFWDETVTPNTVESIYLDRLHGTGGGAHTTSYQLFLETVQNAVIQQPYSVAIKRLMALAKDVKGLPGYLDTLEQRKLFDACEDTYNDAVKIADTSTNIGYYLEILATDYVKLRNGIKYTYLDDDEGDKGGYNEASNLKAASQAHQDVDWDNIDTALSAATPTTAQEAQIEHFNSFVLSAADLIDTRNVAPPSGKDAKKKWLRRWKSIIRQHVGTIIAAHPGVDAAADTVIEYLVAAVGKKVGMEKSDRKDLVTVMKGSKEGWENIEAEP
jgi:hypothetical protein